MKRKLGKFEMAQTISSEYAPFNAVGILHLKNGPEPEILRKSLDILQQRHPLLRVGILKKRNHYFFDSEESRDIPLKIIARSHENQWRSITEDELNTSIPIEAGPLIRFVYITSGSPNSQCELIISIHHSIVDASSAVHISHEILSICHALNAGISTAEYTPLPLLPPEEKFFPAKFQNLSLRWYIMRFFIRQIGDEINYRRSMRGKTKALIHQTGRGKILSSSITAKDTEKLVRRSRKQRVTLNSALSAALLMAVAKHLYKGQNIPLRIFIFPDLRSYLVPPVSAENLGGYHSILRITIPVSPNQDYWNLADDINQRVQKAFKQGDKFISPLLSPQMMRMIISTKSMRMGNTALSYPGVTKIKPFYGSIKVEQLHAFVSNFPLGPEYTTTVRIFKGRLLWDMLYMDTDMDQKQAQCIADEICSILISAGE